MFETVVMGLLYWIFVALVMIWLELAGAGKVLRAYIRQRRVKVWLWLVGAMVLLLVVRYV